MLRSLKNMAITVLPEFLKTYWLVPFAAVMGIIILFAAAATHTQTMFYISSMISFFVILMLSVLGASTQVPKVFSLSVGMGMTRRHFVPCYTLVILLEMMILFAGLELICAVEGWIIETKFPQLPVEQGVEVLLRSRLIIPFVLLMCALHLFVGVLGLKIGGRMYLFSFCGIYAIAILISRVAKDHPQMSANVVAVLTRVSVTGWGIMISCVALLMYVASYLMIRRQQV
ncbi:MAG: hypothetical protein J6P60_05845 [Lachnospiraceae bacterium]|nr:hypothetical protein [Lachnospiraceae bacterium]